MLQLYMVLIMLFCYRIWQQDETSFSWLSRWSVCPAPQDWKAWSAELFAQM